MTELLQDLRFSVRTLLKRPGFLAVAVCSLALGIGANSTIFSIVSAIFLNPLPVEAPSELVAVYTVDSTNPALALTGMSFPNFEDYRDENEVFDGVIAWSFPNPTSLLVSEEPEQVFTELVSGDYFDVLGVRPETGRFILPEEDEAEGANPVAVMSYGLWSRRFGGDPSVVGRTVVINGLSYDVVGVAPEGFKGVNALFSPDFWVPMMMYRQVIPAAFHPWFDDRRALFISMAARLSPGMSVERAQASLKTLASALEQEYPEPNRGRSVELRPVVEATVFPGMRDALVVGSAILMTIVGLVLLIACFNVANLMLAKASGRRKEIAVRLSLGAGRFQLMRQLLTESMLLGLLGGMLGLLVAVWGTDLIWSMRPPIVGNALVQPSIDGPVLTFTLAISLVTGAIFGLIPALQSSRPNVVDALKEETRTAGQGGKLLSLRSALVVAQVFLSIVSLVTAGLFLRSLGSAHEIDPGFETERLAVLTVNPGQAGYSAPQGEAYYERLLERVEAEPTVVSASLASTPPMLGGFSRTIFLEGQPQDEGARIFALTNNVAVGYFETTGIPLVQGRDFAQSDREDSVPVAIINEKMAADLFPDTEPLGKRFQFYGDGFYHEIIGVAATAKYQTLGEDPLMAVYLPRRQNYSDSMILHVRSTGEPTLALGSAQRIVREIDAQVPTTAAWTMTEVIDQSLWGARMIAILLGSLGSLALALASIGLYGVLAYTVAQRNHEIGLRMALGASQSNVLSMVLKHAMLLVGVGTGLGIAAALALSNVASSILYGSARDPLTFVMVPASLIVVALIASLIPALRASRVDPLVALRYE